MSKFTSPGKGRKSDRRAEAALKTARTSSAVEGIRAPFDRQSVREVAYDSHPPARFPGSVK